MMALMMALMMAFGDTSSAGRCTGMFMMVRSLGAVESRRSQRWSALLRGYKDVGIMPVCLSLLAHTMGITCSSSEYRIRGDGCRRLFVVQPVRRAKERMGQKLSITHRRDPATTFILLHAFWICQAQLRDPSDTNAEQYLDLSCYHASSLQMLSCSCPRGGVDAYQAFVPRILSLPHPTSHWNNCAWRSCHLSHP